MSGLMLPPHLGGIIFSFSKPTNLWFALCTVLIAFNLDSGPIVTSWSPGILVCSFLGLSPFRTHCWAHRKCSWNDCSGGDLDLGQEMGSGACSKMLGITF